MTINIQTLINEIESRLAAADSSVPITDQIRLQKLANNAAATGGILEYRSVNELPIIDSSLTGSIVYVRDTQIDRYGSFYMGLNQSGVMEWTQLVLTADSDEAQFEFPKYYPGTLYGYVTGGSAPPVTVDTIQKFSFTTDENATNVGTLSQTVSEGSGVGSKQHGYVLGGSGSGILTANIEKFPFANDGAATVVGSLAVATRDASTPGNSAVEQGYGYIASGSSPPAITRIEKISFTTDGDGTVIGDLSVNRSLTMGHSSNEDGYVTGSLNPVVSVQTMIEKFSFSIDVSAVDIGDLTEAMSQGAGLSSKENAYVAGNTRNVDKFSFASNGNAVSLGDLLAIVDGSLFQYPGGHSSVDYGYVTGGLKPTLTNNIEKFPFAAETSGANIADLTIAVHSTQSHHI